MLFSIMEPQKYFDSQDKSPELWKSEQLKTNRNNFFNKKLRRQGIVVIYVVNVKD